MENNKEQERIENKVRQGVGYTNLTKSSHPNFCDDHGNCYLVKCPSCKKENYALAVCSGQCAWCGFDLNKFINTTPPKQGTRRLSFRPFRRVGNKLVVTSYMGWRKIYTANYEGAIVKLLPFPEIKKGEVIYAMGNPEGDYKFWHPTKFEPLFWPVNGIIKHIGYGKNSEVVFESGVVIGHYGDYEIKDNEVYSMFDCDGCPCFSHKTVVYVSENYPEKMHLFEPLTAEIVYKYFEIMRDTLDKIQWYNTQTKSPNHG